MTETTLDSTVYWRQLDIISPEIISAVNPTLIGVGGLGSPTAWALAKMGVKEMTIYDPDVVDIHNVPNQMYSANDIGSYKVDAIANFVAGFGAKVTGIKEMYEEQHLSGLVIVSVDNMVGRKKVFETIKYSPSVPLFIDMRMSAEVGRIFAVRPYLPDDIAFWEENYYDDENAEELPCTAQAIIYNTLSMASWTAKIVKEFALGNEHPREIILDMVTYGVYVR